MATANKPIVLHATVCFKKIIKSVSAPVTLALAHQEITELWKWFSTKRQEIDDILEEYPVSEFPDMPIIDQRSCQKRCKQLFSEFRSEFFSTHTDKNDFSDKEFPVRQSDIIKAAEIIVDMNRLLSLR